MKNETLRIVIAEDDPAHAAAVQRGLQRYFPNARIEQVTGIHAFRDSVAFKPPEIALMDMNLSNGNSIELLSAFAGDMSFPVFSQPFPGRCTMSSM